ncbi:MAG: hypothetical protein HY865_24730 [Chloroflexi bacterium]|nr:hypothetical protein [Chloroflexota bacterium]
MKRYARVTYVALLVVFLTVCAAPIQISPTTSPTQTLTSAKDLIKPGDKIGEMVIEREDSKHFYWLVDSCNFDLTITKPHSQTMAKTQKRNGP